MLRKRILARPSYMMPRVVTEVMEAILEITEKPACVIAWSIIKLNLPEDIQRAIDTSVVGPFPTFL